MNGPDQRVVIVDLRIPFFRLVLFLVKAALAAIPAAIILAFILTLLAAAAGALLGNSFSFAIHRMTL
jgi:hypothetical protein